MFTSYNISSVIVRKNYLLTGQIDKVTSVLTSIFVELNLNSQNICPISHNYTLKLLPPPTVVYVFSR